MDNSIYHSTPIQLKYENDKIQSEKHPRESFMNVLVIQQQQYLLKDEAEAMGSLIPRIQKPQYFQHLNEVNRKG